MVKSKSKRQRDIKSKLMAAVCMLLVSSIMMVSSTYAWFTLSTAPEVTGIQTAVGANGNLEMALQPKTGDLNSITSEAGDSNLDVVERNVTWGNLVDLDDDSYGLESIVLYPSALAETAGTIDTNFLSYPKYGADGRVSALANDTTTGTRTDAGVFQPDNLYGVRAVGSVSGMTERQSAYRTALSAANSAAADAKNKASNTLNTHGSALASIAMTHGMAEETDTNAYTAADVQAVANMVAGLENALASVETAYRQYILAFAASAEAGTADTAWTAVSAMVNGTSTLSELVTEIEQYARMPAELATGIAAYNTAAGDVANAKGALPTITEGSTYQWNDFGSAVGYLMDSTQMKANEFTIEEVKANPSALVTSAMSNGLTLYIATGGGVFADIADQCGDYTASIKMDINYNGLKLENMTATMKTKTTVDPTYLTALKTGANTAGYPAGSDNRNQPISEMYGYIVDMAFRTNAAASNLLLQQEAVDRIYDGNNNAETMGHGSSMTFLGAADLTIDQVRALMGCIRIVFFGTDSRNIMARARLDMTRATSGADGITAPMYLTAADGEAADSTNVIMALTQNDATKLSVLVYLDGETITNLSVSASGTNSMKGTMNLQFASSANLVPMEYAGLHISDGTGAASYIPVEASAFSATETYYIKKYTQAEVTTETFANLKATLYTSDGTNYTKVADDADFAEGTTYYTDSGNYVVDDNVTAENFDSKKANLYIKN